MALKYLFTGHGYSNNNTTTFYNQFITQTNVPVFSFPVEVTPGRFANTAGCYSGGRGINENGHATVLLNAFGLNPDKIVRVAMDCKFSFFYGYQPTRYILGFTNGGVLLPLNTFFPPTDATNQAGQYCSIYQDITGRILLRSTSTTLATSTNSFANDVWYRFEIEANLQTSGSFKLWVNGNLEINYSGDVTSGVTTGLYRLRFGDAYFETSTVALWDDIGSDGFTGYLGDFEPAQILPDGIGSITQGTPVGAANNWQAVDETFRNGNTDYVTLSATSSQKDLYTYSNVGITGNVISVASLPSAWLANTGTARLKFEASSNSANASTTNSPPLTNPSSLVYGPVFGVFEIPLDPNTNSAWTVSSINAAEFGVSANI